MSCVYHLLGEVMADGRYRVYRRGRRVEGPWDLDPACSCVLDVADRGPHTLEDVGAALGVTRERVRQIEFRLFSRATDATKISVARREFGRLWALYCEDDVPPVERLGLPLVAVGRIDEV